MVSPETFGWLMLVVPSRSYKIDPRLYPIKHDDIVRAMKFLKENNETYYVIYRFMLESGARIVHTLRMLRE